MGREALLELKVFFDKSIPGDIPVIEERRLVTRLPPDQTCVGAFHWRVAELPFA
ncbi:hypothetical protein [Burkholderia ubonensis]|uniref:hypothetical protein n=1 Tax=Burkholderia ubonensis TaxID=101571 RepID=UPI000A67653F|nr:hypothetical protein [Burkholderia ubonensis]